MEKLLGKISKIWIFLRKPFVITVSIVLIVLYGIYLFAQDRITGDTASHILLAISPILKIGIPYKDIWEIKPPSWPLVVFLWSNLFGFGISSIKILNLIIVVLVPLFIYLIYKKVFTTPIIELLFLFTVLINISPLLETLILPTEIVGLMFSLAALFYILNAKKDVWRFGFSGALFFLASQTKEPYTFTVLSALPVLLFELLKKDYLQFFRKIVIFVSGIIGGAAILFLYLTKTGSLNAYSQIFQYKTVFFPFNLDRMFRNVGPAITATNNTFIEFSGGLLLLLLLAFLIFLFTNRFKRTVILAPREVELTLKSTVILDKNSLPKYVVAFYAIGSFFGFGLGGAFGSHYLIQVVVPFYLLCGLIVSYIYGEFIFLVKKNNTYLFVGLSILLLSLMIVLPKRQYVKSFWVKDIRIETKDSIHGYEKRISELTTSKQCVLSVYGWGMGENYLYSQRKPCTRFFLPNMVRQDWQGREYAQSIIDNPPAVIRYERAGADMNIEKFEAEIINLQKVIKNCYKQDSLENTLYVPVTDNTIDLRDCIKNSS